MDFLELNMTDFNTTEEFGLNVSLISSTHDSGIASVGRWSSCNQVYTFYGDDGAWCLTFKEGDYLQVFTIALLVWLMYLAAYCLAYARTAAYIGGLSEMAVSEMKSKSAWTEIKEKSDKYMYEGYVSGMPAPFYVILNAILSSAYFAIKLIMYLEDDPNYLATINADYNSNSYQDFYDARIILLVTIYVHSFMSIKQNMTIFKENRDYGGTGCANVIYVICSLIFFTDFIGSIVLMCIKYPLIITSLYNGAVGILVNCALICTSCCILPLLSFYGKLISMIFALFVCGAGIDQPCGRFMRGVANGFVLLSFGYLIVCCVLCFAFLFLGGPNEAIIYLRTDPDKSMDMIICWIYVGAMCVGVLGFIIGAMVTLSKQCNDNRGGGNARSKGQYQHPRNTNDFNNEVTMV